MKISRFTAYKGKLRIEDAERQQIKDDFIEINVSFSSVASGDCQIYNGESKMVRLYAGFLSPKKISILGGEFSGVITGIGKNVQTFNVGDMVYGFSENFGCHSEYIQVKWDSCIDKVPDNISLIDSACSPFGALSANYFLHDLAKIQYGETILINGASGAVGLAAIQIAKEAGCDVTAISSSDNLGILKKFGANKTIAYDLVDISKISFKFDIIFDVNGNLIFQDMKRCLNPSARFVTTKFSLSDLISQIWLRQNNYKYLSGFAKFTQTALKEMSTLLKKKILNVNVDKVYKFDEVQEAIDFVNSNRKVGSVCIDIKSKCN